MSWLLFKGTGILLPSHNVPYGPALEGFYQCNWQLSARKLSHLLKLDRSTSSKIISMLIITRGTKCFIFGQYKIL